MTPQQLRNSILQMAIEGKLVEQRPEEGTGEKLYQLIQEEKQELIKSGKLKKQKELPEITEDEIPFEIPASWKWVRLSECLDVRDGTHDTPQYVEKGIPLVTSKNLVNGKIDFITCKMISLEDYLKFSERSKVDINDILFAMIGSIGNPVLVSDENKFSIKNMALFKNTYKNIDMNYLYWFLCYSQRAMKIKASGGVQSFVSLTFLRKFLFPLPPIEEQMRIVEKIKAIFPIIDRYESVWQKLNELNKKFPEELQKSILQEAIQGKLCRQNANDGSAQELIEKILLEKERLIESGQIKKQKALPPIQEEEIPFDIPENWCWERLGNISTYNQSKTKVKASDLKQLTWVLDLEDIEKNTGNILERINAKDKKVSGDKVAFYKGQLLYSKLRPYLKKILIAPDDGVCTPELVPFNVFGECNTKYILSVLKSPYADFLINSATYGVKMPRVGVETMINLLIPIPPLREQDRLVKTIENSIPLIEKLKRLI